MRKLTYQFPNNIPIHRVYQIAALLTWNMPSVNITLQHTESTEQTRSRYTLVAEGENNKDVGTAILFARFSIDLLTKE